MVLLRRFTYSVALFAFAVTLAACGNPSAGTTTPQMAPPARIARHAQRLLNESDLLYVAHSRSFYDTRAVISMIALPSLKPVRTFAVEQLYGICSDASTGNVWIAVWRPGAPKGYYLLEYAHGATEKIGEIRMPRRTFANGCAVDPNSGDLAVMNFAGEVVIWPGGRQGNPNVYKVPFSPENGVYDDSGNLFVDGYPNGSDPGFFLGTLAKGSGAIATVRLDRKTALPGGIAWDGKYVAVETGGYRPLMRGDPRIYRVRISDSSGNVVGEVIPKDPPLHGAALFALYGDRVVSMAGHGARLVEEWPYPQGGPHTQMIRRFQYVRGMTISVAPKS